MRQRKWNIHATDAGQNTIKITLGINYVYLSGQEADGMIEVTAAPIPIVAVATTPSLSRPPPPAPSPAGVH
jgi:hypothetical protein